MVIIITPKRVLGFWDALAIGVGATIGPGIFTVVAPLVKATSSAAFLPFMITGTVLLFSVLAHARLAARYPSTGGFYVFVNRAFGLTGAFIIGWSFCLSAASAGAFVALGFADYLNTLIPLPRLPVAFAVIVVYTLLNIAGIRSVAFVQKVFAALIISTIFLVIIAGWLCGKVLPANVELPSFNALLYGSLLVFTLFAGFEVIGSVAGEVKNPEKVLPTSMIATLLVAIFVYCALTMVTLATCGSKLIAESSAPIERVANTLLSKWGSYGVVTAVLLGSMSVVNGQILLISRVLSAMASDGAIPKIFSNFKISASIAGLIISVLLTVFPSVGLLAQTASFFFVIMLIFTNLSYLKLFKVKKLRQLPFAVTLILPLIFLFGVKFEALSVIILWVIFGCVIFVAYKLRSQKRRLFRFIDVYPDLAIYIIVSIASALQLLIGNKIDAVITSISLMLPTLIATVPINIVLKKLFKAKRPEQYYESVKDRTVFEGSFPSFHSQFSAGEATTFIIGIALFSPENIRLTATFLAIITVGLASVVIAYSRVALKMHYSLDALGGFVLGVATGFVVSYAIARLWDQIPLMYHIVMISVFVTLVFLLSRKQRKIKV